MDREAMIAALIFGGSGSGGGGGADAPLVVTFSKPNSAIECDTSIDDILTASAAGKIVYGIVPTQIATNSHIGGNIGIFRLAATNAIAKYVEFYSIAQTPSDVGTPAEVYALRLHGFKWMSTDSWTYYAEPTKATANLALAGTESALTSLYVDGTKYKVEDKGAPFYVTFTVAGQPVGGVYPLSADKTFADIAAAIDAGYDVIGMGSLDGISILTARISAVEYDADDDLDYVGFSLLGRMSGSPVLGSVSYPDTGSITMQVLPLSTAQMTYDSATQTLAIVDPLA